MWIIESVHFWVCCKLQMNSNFYAALMMSLTLPRRGPCDNFVISKGHVKNLVDDDDDDDEHR